MTIFLVTIGTNDLSQYVMDCDRKNPKVANLADALQPAVLSLNNKNIVRYSQT
jgi:phosphoenolpyruvate-protein kinase (PTS system EI component)